MPKNLIAVLLFSGFFSGAHSQDIQLALSGYFDWMIPVEVRVGGVQEDLTGYMSLGGSGQEFPLEGRMDQAGTIHLFEMTQNLISGHLRLRKIEDYYSGSWLNADFDLQFPVILYEGNQKPDLRQLHCAAAYRGVIDDEVFQMICLITGGEVRGEVFLKEKSCSFVTTLDVADLRLFSIRDEELEKFRWDSISCTLTDSGISLEVHRYGQVRHDMDLNLIRKMPLKYDWQHNFAKLYHSAYFPVRDFNAYAWFRKGLKSTYDDHPSNRLKFQSYIWPQLIWLDADLLSAYYVLSDTEWNADSVIAINVDLALDQPISMEEQFRPKVDVLDFCRLYALDKARSRQLPNVDISLDNIRDFAQLLIRKDGLVLISDYRPLTGVERIVVPKSELEPLVRKKSFLSRYWEFN